MSIRSLTALPVYNEVEHVADVLCGALCYSNDVLVVDDGSTDGTPELLASRHDIQVVSHAENIGYGAALRSAFDYALAKDYDVLVTIDCDGQHQPRLIPRFVEACRGVDMVSGSRYLELPSDQPAPPEDRRRINRLITKELNQRLDLELTDAFCGFKAYRVAALASLDPTDPGYAMPLELWAQAAALGWKIVELPVPLIYLDEKRSFGGALDDGATRLAIYRDVLQRSIDRARQMSPAVCGEATE